MKESLNDIPSTRNVTKIMCLEMLKCYTTCIIYLVLIFRQLKMKFEKINLVYFVYS